MSVLIGVWMLACSERPSDEALYKQALTSPGQEALEICGRVQAPTVRADCLLGVAGAAARSDQPELAWKACRLETLEGFHDECVFLVVDTLPLDGPEAWTRCESAGQYRDNCVGHILTDHLDALEGLTEEVGQEEQLRLELARAGSKLDMKLRRDHFQRSVTTALTRHVARRWADRPFDHEDCGSLDDELCRRSYAETMSAHQEGIDQAAVCASDLSLDAVVAAGGTPWVPRSQELAQQSWRSLCDSWGMSAG